MHCECFCCQNSRICEVNKCNGTGLCFLSELKWFAIWVTLPKIWSSGSYHVGQSKCRFKKLYALLCYYYFPHLYLVFVNFDIWIWYCTVWGFEPAYLVWSFGQHCFLPVYLCLFLFCLTSNLWLLLLLCCCTFHIPVTKNLVIWICAWNLRQVGAPFW